MNNNIQYIVEHKSTFRSEARTLSPSEVSNEKRVCGMSTKTHPSGWTISGEIKEDYYYWVNKFSARHPEYGSVYGDFEEKVYADSQEAYEHFVKHHPPKEWDYHDI